MLLKTFLDTKQGRQLSQREWADRLGVSRGYFNQLVHGTKSPSLPLALLVDKYTGGVVGPYDWPQAQPGKESTDGGNQD
jgi:transcriptional regulator with XRE-family HTH domain